MDFESFKEIYASKSPVEKLDLLLVQVDYYGIDQRDYAEAKYGRRNAEEAKYYYDESVAMMERILWLRDEIEKALENQEEVE